MDLREIWCYDVNWIHVTKNRDQWWTFVNIRVPQTVGNLLTI